MMTFKTSLCALGTALTFGAATAHAQPVMPAPPLAKAPAATDNLRANQVSATRSKGQLETVAQFFGPMPTGVTVSQKGRIFVNFPRWGDNVPFTVAEIVNGKAVGFPSTEINDFGTNGTRAALSMRNSPAAQKQRAAHLVGVQSVVVDAADRLWILDTGSIVFNPTMPGGPKLIGVDLTTNKIVKTIQFAPDIARPKSYFNDVRFDLRAGKEGTAYITDSGDSGIVVVDLASGIATRRLDKHFSTQLVPKFVPYIEGDAMYSTKPGKFPGFVQFASDGIALSADGSRLFYCPLASRHLYSVSTALLRNGKAAEALVENSVIDHGEKGMSDGLEADAQGRVYVTLPEQNAIARRLPNSLYQTVVRDPRLLWPDTLSIANDGYIYVISNQLHRQKGYNYGKDLRVKPYSLFRVKIDGTPILLK